MDLLVNAIPNPGKYAENAIMAPWQDLNTGIGGAIYYGMTGIAPNRIYTVTWCAVPMFHCTSDLHTSQLFYMKGSDKIEMFIQDKPICIGWNGGAAIQGLVDATSTNFDIVNDPFCYYQETGHFLGQQLMKVGSFYQIHQLIHIPLIQLLMCLLLLELTLGL